MCPGTLAGHQGGHLLAHMKHGVHNTTFRQTAARRPSQTRCVREHDRSRALYIHCTTITTRPHADDTNQVLPEESSDTAARSPCRAGAGASARFTPVLLPGRIEKQQHLHQAPLALSLAPLVCAIRDVRHTPLSIQNNA